MKTVDFRKTGHGQWKASTIHYGKEISMHFTCAPTYDLIYSRERGYKSAIKSVRNQIIWANKNK